MITLTESILKSTNAGQDVILKDVYNNTVKWLNESNNFYCLTKDEITIKPKYDGYYLKINCNGLNIVINKRPPYHFSEVLNKNNQALNFLFREFHTDDMPAVVNDRICFGGCIIKIDAVINKLPKNCKYLIFYPAVINNRKIPCKLNGIIKDITVDKFICGDEYSLDWDAHNIKNITVKNECIISFVKKFSDSTKQNMLTDLIKNNHLNLDKLYIRDCSSECTYEKVIYDKHVKKIKFQKIRGMELIKPLNDCVKS